MSVDTVAGTTVWRLRLANVWVNNASGMIYCSNILTLATKGLFLLTVSGTTVWRLRVANFAWLLRAECFTAVTF